MTKNQSGLNKNSISLIKGIYNQALSDIEKIKKERDKKVMNILKDIDNKHIAKIRQDIKNLK